MSYSTNEKTKCKRTKIVKTQNKGERNDSDEMVWNGIILIWKWQRERSSNSFIRFAVIADDKFDTFNKIIID